jgi:hypothetical protein
MSLRSRVLGVAAAAAAIAVLPAASAVAKPTAVASQTQRCPKFWVVRDDPQSGFTAGRYFRLNFAPTVSTLSCDYTYHVLRSYLYEPRTLTGWTVGPLIGELRGQLGRHFVKRGSNSRVGFDVFRQPTS